MKIDDRIWQSSEIAKHFLDIRGGLPLAKDQVETMLRLINYDRKKVNNVLDIGCGDGILGHAILVQNLDSFGTFLDFSETMIRSAKDKLKDLKHRCDFITEDYGNSKWLKRLGDKRFDVIVSGFSIHHQPDERKKEVYKEIFDLLEPDGIFLNLEHVSIPSSWLETFADNLVIDSLYVHQKKNNPLITRDAVAKSLYKRKEANILTPVEIQCEWLKELGYLHVDCYFKWFMVAIFGGIRPSANKGF